MNRISLSLDRRQRDGRDVFKAVVAYQDEVTGRAAKDATDSVLEALGPGSAYACHLWRFDLLQRAQAYYLAYDDAVAADMILIAAYGAQELPQTVRQWAAGWASKKAESECTVIVLLDSLSACRDESPAYTYLEQIAETHRLNFVSKAVQFPANPSSHHEHRAFLLLQNNLYTGSGYRGWGINE